MKEKISIYCSYKFDKFNGCKVGFMISDSNKTMLIYDTKTAGSETLEKESIIKALEYFKSQKSIEIFMLPNKLQKKLISKKENRETKAFKEFLLKNSTFIYWLRKNEKNHFIDELNREMEK